MLMQPSICQACWDLLKAAVDSAKAGGYPFAGNYCEHTQCFVQAELDNDRAIISVVGPLTREEYSGLVADTFGDHAVSIGHG